jgi:hypothetical protein
MMRSEFEMICYLAKFEDDADRLAESRAICPDGDRALMLFRRACSLRGTIRQLARHEAWRRP